MDFLGDLMSPFPMQLVLQLSQASFYKSLLLLS